MKKNVCILLFFFTLSLSFAQEVCNTYTVNPGTFIDPVGTDFYETTINVPDNYLISDVNITINIDHTWDEDLIIFLTSPSGTTVDLSIGNGGDGDDYINTIFDDDGVTNIIDGSPPFTGTFQPEGFLGDFNNELANGDWILTVEDTANEDGGTINTITLELCYTPISPLSGHLGPGGVGATTGESNNLNLWLQSGEGLSLSGTDVTAWNDQSGAGNHVLQAISSDRPSEVTGAINGFSTVQFDGSNDVLSSGSLSGVSSPANNYTLFFVWQNTEGSPNNNDAVFSGNNSSSVSDIQFSHRGNRFNYKGTNSTDYEVGTLAQMSSFNITTMERFDDGTGSEFNSWVNATNTNSGSESSNWANNFALYKFGENRGENRYLGLDLAEAVIIQNKISIAERIIIQNYLAAKFGLAINASEDFYTQDEGANGDFDFDVAGIGQDTVGNNSVDSQGTGIVRVNTPSNLENDEYLFWGRNTNADSYSFSTVGYKERINATWRVNKRNDLGTVTMSFDMTGIDLSSIPSCKSLQLIVDNDADLATPTNTYNLINTSGNIYEATTVTLLDGDYFTLQYVDKIVLDVTGFYNGSGVGGQPDETDDCLDLLIKTDATGSLTLSENADVNSIEVEAGGNFVIDDGFRIQVTNGIQLDGDIRLLGSSQIIQTHSGASLISGSGNLYVDQATAANDSYGGTANYKSLYWGSPVSSSGTPGTFMIADVLKDGTSPTTATSTPVDIDFISDWNGDDSSPIKISTRWLSKLINALSWTENIDPDTETFNVGEGWNMKSTDANNQNFTFYGTPNDGDYTITGVSDYVYFVLGNPYPSAFDAHQFINDNENVLNPTMYFYDSTYDYSHYYQEFAGGYGYIQKVGGIFTAMKAAGGVETKEPEQYLPIGQGFLMYSLETIAPATTREIVFNNNQRIFRTRSDADSEFIARTATSQKNEEATPLLKISFEFLVEELGKQQRSLAVVFCGESSEFDEGSDAYLLDRRPIDLVLRTPSDENAMLGVSAIERFNTDLEIPLALYLNKDKEVTFKITEKKDFPDTDIYLKDAETNQYYNISNPNLSVNIELSQGNYLDRFSIVFKNENSLSTHDITTDKNLNAFVDKATNEIVIQQKNQVVKTVQLFNLVGQEITSWKNTKTTSEIRFKKQNLQTSVYILKLKTEEGKEFTKKIVLN